MYVLLDDWKLGEIFYRSNGSHREYVIEMGKTLMFGRSVRVIQLWLIGSFLLGTFAVIWACFRDIQVTSEGLLARVLSWENLVVT